MNLLKCARNGSVTSPKLDSIMTQSTMTYSTQYVLICPTFARLECEYQDSQEIMVCEGNQGH